MRTIREWIHRLLGTVRPSRRDGDLAEELRAHAKLAAERGHRVTGAVQAMDALRDQRGLPWLDDLARDIKHAFRSLWRSPAFTVVAVVTLALGMAATVAIVSVLDQVVLRPLPYPDIERLVRITSPVPGVRPDASWNLSTAEYFYFGREASTLERIGIYVGSTATVGAGAGRPDASAERVVTALVSPEVFGLIGAQPVLGRVFVEGDHRYDARNGPPVVVISHDVWRSRFGSAADVVGRPIVLDERAIPILGVMAPGTELPEATFLSTRTIGVWMPLALNPNAPAVNQHTFRAIARLRRGVEHAAAQRELDALTSRLPELFPSAYSPAFWESSGFSTAITPLVDDVLGPTSRIVWLLAGAISLLFVIAAANVTNLFLLRAEARHRELATRLALGATRLGLARYTMAESLLLSAMAGVAAVGLTSVALRVLIDTAPGNIPRLQHVHVNGTTLLVTTSVALVAAVCIALFTTVRVGTGAMTTLRQGAPTPSRRQQATKSTLVVAQVAVSLVLACAGALMAQSVWRLVRVDPGFDATDVVTAAVLLPRTRYASEEQIAAYHRELASVLEADPEIARAGAASSIPLDGNDGCSAVFIEGRSRFDGNSNVCLDVSRVTPGYFDTLGISVRGRTPGWDVEGTGEAVVSESAARRIWPGENPIGKGIRVNGSAPPFYRVVGVAVDVRRHGLDRPAAESVYFPAMGMAAAPVFAPPRFMRIVIRTNTDDALSVIPRVRAMVAAIDSNVPIAEVQAMEDAVAASMARSALAAFLLTAAALLAMILSAVGLYGVISYGVASRQRELGVRLAVGARPLGIRGMVLRETLRLVLPGLALGAIVSLSSARLLEGLLFGIEARDAATLLGVSAVLLLTGLAAGAVPAWRASGTDPLMALRCE